MLLTGIERGARTHTSEDLGDAFIQAQVNRIYEEAKLAARYAGGSPAPLEIIRKTVESAWSNHDGAGARQDFIVDDLTTLRGESIKKNSQIIEEAERRGISVEVYLQQAIDSAIQELTMAHDDVVKTNLELSIVFQKHHEMPEMLKSA